MNWDWPLFFSKVDTATEAEIRESGFGATAKNVHAVLRACPHLRYVSVHWYNPPRDSDTTYLASDFTNSAFPRERRMDPNIFGDNFCAALATFCPQLEDLTVASMAIDAPYEGYIKSFTDRGPRALATLPMLAHVDVDVLCVSGAGLCSFIADHVAATRADRTISLRVGGPTDDGADMSFYNCLSVFLEMLAQYEGALPCEKRGVLLVLQNQSKAAVGRVWTRQYLARITESMEQVKQKHDIDLHVCVTRYDPSGSFEVLDEFVLFVGTCERSVGSFDEHEQISQFVYHRLPGSEEIEEEEGEGNEADRFAEAFWDSVYGMDHGDGESDDDDDGDDDEEVDDDEDEDHETDGNGEEAADMVRIRAFELRPSHSFSNPPSTPPNVSRPTTQSEFIFHSP